MSPEPSLPPGSARARAFRRILAEMLKIDRVRGGLVVAADGLVIAASVPRGVAVEPLAARGGRGPAEAHALPGRSFLGG